MKTNKRYKTKPYKHIDHSIEYSTVKDYVTNPNKISKHGFLPFIKYIAETEKMIDKANPEINNRPIKRKERPLMYAGHLDSFIYQYYSEKLNKAYNTYVEKNFINHCAIAYRSFLQNEDKKSNIHHAAEVINFIKNTDNSLIIVGDFSDYFGTIDHFILKRNLTNVLGLERLPKDWFNVFNSITKYGFYMKDNFDHPSEGEKVFFEQKRKMYFRSVKHFRKYQKNSKCENNDNTYGIPQGSAISAVFSNLYAIDFDIAMNYLANELAGMYRRYSDDFILVVPNKDPDFNKQQILDKITCMATRLKITIHEEKKFSLYYDGESIKDCKTGELSALDYLGFVFNGSDVEMRSKSPYKFYRKAKKMIRLAHYVRLKYNLKKLPYRKQIYGLYTDMGIDRGEYGNFITYAKRSNEIFDKISPHTNNLMMKQIENRKRKIEKSLGYRIHV